MSRHCDGGSGKAGEAAERLTHPSALTASHFCCKTEAKQ